MKKRTKEYQAKVRFTFEGIININTENKEVAHEYLDKHFGMACGKVHRLRGCGKIFGWEFPAYAEKKIINILKGEEEY